jgi:polysaccharide biosynthesis/export protein
MMKVTSVLLLFLLVAYVGPQTPLAAQQAPPAPLPKALPDQKLPDAKPALSVPSVQDPAKMAESPSVPGAKPASAPLIGANYVIGPEDVVAIKVWEDPHFNGSVRVLPDGQISLPLAGQVVAAGLTPTQLEEAINKALENCCLQKAHASVQIEGVNSKKIYFDGDGITQGPMNLAVPLHLLEAISAKGGFRDFADKKHIQILRDGKLYKVVNYNDLIKGKKPEFNILLQPGDHIVVK